MDTGLGPYTVTNLSITAVPTDQVEDCQTGLRPFRKTNNETNVSQVYTDQAHMHEEQVS